MHRILLAISGMSPQVITETLYERDRLKVEYPERLRAPNQLSETARLQTSTFARSRWYIKGADKAEPHRMTGEPEKQGGKHVLITRFHNMERLQLTVEFLTPTFIEHDLTY